MTLFEECDEKKVLKMTILKRCVINTETQDSIVSLFT